MTMQTRVVIWIDRVKISMNQRVVLKSSFSSLSTLKLVQSHAAILVPWARFLKSPINLTQG